MNKPFMVLALCGTIAAHPHTARAQAPPAETQALVKQLNQLMRNPQKPKQDVTLTLSGCHAEQLIRDRGADVHTSKPLAVSFNTGNSGWAMKMNEGVFEMKMSFEWADITSLTYEPVTNDDGPKHFQIKLAKGSKGNHMNFEMPLYTTSEATVQDVLRRLEKVRHSCR